MISDRETNTIYFSEKLKTDFSKTCDQIIDVLQLKGITPIFLQNTKDIWARDYMPIQVSKDKFIEYRYDPDYLQGTAKNRRELKTYPDIVCDAIKLSTIKTDIILDGGNVVKSKNAIILTDKVVIENSRNYNKHQLLNKLHEFFEVSKVVLIPWDLECDFGHADGMLRFINEDTVLISGFYETADKALKESILKSLKKSHLKCEWLRVSAKEREKNIAYINFLQTKDLILIPKMKVVEDDKAFEQISKYYPDYAENSKIAQVDMTEIVKFDGALNCISWTIAE